MISFSITILNSETGVKVKIHTGSRTTPSHEELEAERRLLSVIDAENRIGRKDALYAAFNRVVLKLTTHKPLKFGWLEDVEIDPYSSLRDGEVVIVNAPLSVVGQTQTIFWPQACQEIKQELERIAGGVVSVRWNFRGEGGAA